MSATAPGTGPVTGWWRNPAGRLLALLVVGYQRTVSPLLTSSCRFEPSCSAYAVAALRTHGALRGSRLTAWRLLRCQPFGTPGYDPVPPAHRHARPVQGAHHPC